MNGEKVEENEKIRCMGVGGGITSDWDSEQ